MQDTDIQKAIERLVALIATADKGNIELAKQLAIGQGLKDWYDGFITGVENWYYTLMDGDYHSGTTFEQIRGLVNESIEGKVKTVLEWWVVDLNFRTCYDFDTLPDPPFGVERFKVLNVYEMDVIRKLPTWIDDLTLDRICISPRLTNSALSFCCDITPLLAGLQCKRVEVKESVFMQNYERICQTKGLEVVNIRHDELHLREWQPFKDGLQYLSERPSIKLELDCPPMPMPF